jgi:hypothetical protein
LSGGGLVDVLTRARWRFSRRSRERKRGPGRPRRPVVPASDVRRPSSSGQRRLSDGLGNCNRARAGARRRRIDRRL